MFPVILSFIILILTTGITMYFALKGKEMNMKEWAIGGRSFGTLLFWFLSAGEIFTTFAFLGASGWAYQYGAPGFYILANVALGYVLGYWLLPRIWKIGNDHNIFTQADYFRIRFDSRWLSIVMGIVGMLALIPYSQTQFTGLSLIIQILFHGSVDKTWAVIGAGFIVIVFVFTAGMRSTALASIVKDALMIGVLLTVTISLAAVTHLQSITHIFALMNSKHPLYGALPGLLPKKSHTVLWFMSTILMVNVGYWMWPQQFQYTSTARSGDAVRKNAIFQPLYALSYFFIFLIGFTSLLVFPHLTNSNGALLTLISSYYPAWFLGVVGGAGMLIALVPVSGMLLSLGTIFAQAIYKPTFDPNASERKLLMVSRVALVVATIVVVLMTLHSNKTIVAILLVAYSAVSQIGPSFILSLLWKRITRWGVLFGTVAGLIGITVPAVIHAETAVAFTVNTGFIALIINIIFTVVVSLITNQPKDSAIRVGVELEEQNVIYTGATTQNSVR